MRRSPDHGRRPGRDTAVPDLALAHPRAVLPDLCDAVDGVDNVLRQLGHEDQVAVGHDGNRPMLARFRVNVTHD